MSLIRRNPSLAIGLALTLLVVAVALLSLAWTPLPPTRIAIPQKLQGPSAAHWLGTDALGRDVASQIMVGAWNSLRVAVLAVGLGLAAGIGLGTAAAALRGWTDELVMRAADVAFAFPAVLSAIMLTALIGPGVATAVLAIGIFNTPVFARISRAAALQVWTRDFILAARAAGKGTARITLEHVLPNIAGTLVVQATIQTALALLAEAGLSFLGVGIQPPAPSWGRMLFDAQTYLAQAPQLALFAGLAIAVAVLGLNLLGDGLRDLLDPRSRGR